MSASRAQIRQSIARSARQTALIAANETEPGGEMLHGGFIAGALAKPGTEPKWNTIFPRGTWHGPNFARMGGSFTVDDGFMSEVVENWKASGKPRIPVRWGHEHMKAGATPELKRTLDRKAGNVTDLRITAAGLEGLTDWNQEGAADVSSGTFDGWSAEWWPKHVNRLTGETRGWYLSGVALTNEPYFELLPRIAASAVDAHDDAAKWLKAAIARHERHMSGAEATSADSQMKMMEEMRNALSALQEVPPVAASTIPTDPPAAPQGNTMNEAELNQLRASLGLAANTPVAEVLKAASKAGTALTASATQPDNSALIASVKAQDEKLTALVAANAKKDEQLTTLTASLLEKDVDALVATAKKGDGKNGRAITEKHVLRAKKIAKEEGLTASAEFLNEIALTVPVQASGLQGTGEPLTAAAASKQLMARADELRAKGDPSAMVTAMREMPEVALIAEGRPTTSSN